MLHSVGCSQSKAAVFVEGFNNPDALSVHAFIDANSGDVYNTMPWNYKCAHCGSGLNGSGNSTHIGVEMCEPDEIKYVGGATFTITDAKLPAARKKAETAYKSAVELFAYLAGVYNMDPLADGVIISHSEGNARGIASDHADPEHLWKGLGLPYTMDGFRKDVAASMKNEKPEEKSDEDKNVSPTNVYRVRKKWGDASSQLGAFNNLDLAKKLADENPGYKVYNQNGSVAYTPSEESGAKPDAEDKNIPEKTDKLVQVTVSNLNIRTGPGSNYPPNGRYTGRGVFTIVEVQQGEGSDSGWGLLKAYSDGKNGWICLDYVKQL